MLFVYVHVFTKYFSQLLLKYCSELIERHFKVKVLLVLTEHNINVKNNSKNVHFHFDLIKIN